MGKLKINSTASIIEDLNAIIEDKKGALSLNQNSTRIHNVIYLINLGSLYVD